jgi:uncharacterized protein YcbK (DUF882 family)
VTPDSVISTGENTGSGAAIPRGPRCSRRRFLHGLTLGLAAAAAVGDPRRLLAAAAPARHLSFRHTHTDETLRVVYSITGSYQPEALARIDHLLRDFRNGEVHAIDPQLLDLLWDVRQAAGGRGTYEVVSGYRSPATNAELRRQGRGVARRSLHLVGKAIDVRLTGVATATLCDVARDLRRGGVGYYASSNFVHLDTGRVRSW